jgi:rRNA small subunit aminocarboxypropyltransferase
VENNRPTLLTIPVRITIYHANQCDPRKCSGLRLKRRGLARIVTKTRFLPKRAIVLNPFSEIAFSPEDKQKVQDFGLVALDCSWEHAQKVLGGCVKGTSRCLPILIASNPVNFGKLTKLSTAEAIAAALYIVGCQKESEELLSIFTWGHTFFELNGMLLDNYATAKDSGEIVEMQNRLLIEKRSGKSVFC